MKIILYKLEFFLQFFRKFGIFSIFISDFLYPTFSHIPDVMDFEKVKNPRNSSTQYFSICCWKNQKAKKAKNKISIVKKWKKSVKNRRTSILVPNGMPYTRLYGWYQAFARIAQCPGREASLQQALALPQEVRSRREALPTSTLIVTCDGNIPGPSEEFDLSVPDPPCWGGGNFGGVLVVATKWSGTSIAISRVSFSNSTNKLAKWADS